MRNEIEIFHSLERGINNARRSIMEIDRAVNELRKWCKESKEEWDKQSESEKKRLEALSINVFEDISRAEDKLREVRMTAFKGMASIISE